MITALVAGLVNVGMALCLCISRPSSKSVRPNPAVLLAACCAVAVIAFAKLAHAESENDVVVTLVLIAQMGLVVALVTPRTKVERWLEVWLRGAWRCALIAIGCSAVVMFHSTDERYEVKLVRLLSISLPWIAAGSLVAGGGRISVAHLLAIGFTVLTFCLQYEKTPIIAAVLFLGGISLAMPVSRSRKILFLLVSSMLGAIIWSEVLHSRGFSGASDYFHRRVEKSSRDEIRVLGVVADGGRIEIWSNVVDKWTENPIFGTPLSGVRSDYGFDEHNVLLYFLSRTGVVGLGVLLAVALSARMWRWKADRYALARASALMPLLLYGFVGNYLCDSTYLLAAILSVRLLPPKASSETGYGITSFIRIPAQRSRGVVQKLSLAQAAS
jgi:hypothetical protein